MTLLKQPVNLFHFYLCHTYLFVCLIFLNLNSRVQREERQRNLPSSGSLPKWLPWAELGRPNAGVAGFPCGRQDSSN